MFGTWQGITWTNVDQDDRCYMAPLGHEEGEVPELGLAKGHGKKKFLVYDFLYTIITPPDISGEHRVRTRYTASHVSTRDLYISSMWMTST